MDKVIQQLKDSITFVERDLKRQKELIETKKADMKRLQEIITDSEDYIDDCNLAISKIAELGDSKLYNALYGRTEDGKEDTNDSE